MVEQFANNADSTLNGAIDNVTTTIVVANGSVFPSTGNFRLLISSDPDTGEYILVTARSGNTLTVVRGQEGSTAQSWADGTVVTHIMTAGAIITLRDTLKGKTLHSSLETISASQDGYALTWLNTDGYWVARPGSPFTISGNELNTTRTLSIDGYGTYASAHYNPQLYVNGAVLTSASYSVGEIPLNTVIFDYVSDSNQTFVVPAGVTQLQVKMWGPGGGTGNYNGGYGGGSGGYSTGFLSVTPGETLILAVGSGGKKSVSSSGNAGVGGWPGGGNGGRGDASAGGGGGLSGVFTTSYSQANALMIAGGGGGSSGYSGGGTPGAGGGSSGNDGSDTTSGKGGTQVFGGFGGATGNATVYTVTNTTWSGGEYVTGTTDVGNHTDDSPITTIALPFTFTFYGVAYSTIGLSSNGFATFSTDTTYAWDIPSARPPTIALWNRDNTTVGGDRGWYTIVTGSAPNRVFTMEYRGYQLSTTNTINAELKIYEGSNTFEVLYGTSTATDTTGTIGIQNNLGVYYTVFNNNQAPPASGTKLVYSANANIVGKALSGGNAFTDVTTSTANDAGGGGSGYFGGGAGQGDGRMGGGGSGYLHPSRVTNGTTTAGTNGAIGVVGAAPPSNTDTNYTSGIGVGGVASGTGGDGGNGRIVISYGNSSNLATNSLTLGNNASITGPVGFADLYLNTSNNGSVVLNPSSGLVTLQGTSALNSTTDLILSYTNSLKVNSGGTTKLRVFSTGAVTIGETTTNDTAAEAQSGFTGPLINLAPITGGSISSVANQALVFNNAGFGTIQGHNGVTFRVANIIGGFYDANGIFRTGPSSNSTATLQGSTWPITGTDYLWMYNSTGSSWGEIISGGSGTRAAIQIFNNATTNTCGVALYGAGTGHATIEYAGNGVIEQSGNSTSALVFTKRNGTDGLSFASTGAIWQSGAWTIGRSTQNDTSSEAQAGLTGPLLNLTQISGGTVTSVANQSVLFNNAGTVTLQGHVGHSFVANTTIVASTSTSKFITNVGRRIATSVKTANYTVTTSDEVIIVGVLSSSITITLPASPTAGDTYIIKDQAGGSATNNIIVSGNGVNIDGASTYTINTNYQSITVVFANGTWSII